MENTDAVKVLAKVKANWYRQPTDEVVAREWAERLAHVEFGDAIQAVRELADLPQLETPTPGQLAHYAAHIGQRRRDEENAHILRLEAPAPSDEDKRKARATVHSIIERLPRSTQARGVVKAMTEAVSDNPSAERPLEFACGHSGCGACFLTEEKRDQHRADHGL